MTTKPSCKYIPWSSVEHEKLNDLIGREMVVGDNLMLARVFLKKARTCRNTITTTSRSPTSWKAR